MTQWEVAVDLPGTLLQGESDTAPRSAPEAPRGVAPEILLSQVRNTAPFLFEGADLRLPAFIRLLREPLPERLTHVEYFRLCLSAHYATVGTFVPTDVDNQIRHRLWHPVLTARDCEAMAEVVLEAWSWDFRAVTNRWVLVPGEAPVAERILGGHHGEWFSTAVGAYGALRRRSPEKAAEVAGRILEEMEREAAIYQTLKRARDGIGLLKAATLIAHNLGDLDRVIDMWNLPPGDAFREAAYKAGHEDQPRRFGGVLAEAGRLNKALMADENHRHFALRAPKCLRRSPDLCLPVAPFFDEWGMRVARHPALRPEDVSEIVQALVGGWEKLPKTVGYARALAGILEAFPGGPNKLTDYLPAKVARNLKAGLLRSLCSIPRRRFEEQWSQAALNFGKPG